MNKFFLISTLVRYVPPHLESVQKKAMKIVPTLRSLHYADRLAILRLPTFEHRRIRGDLIQYFKCQSGINKVKWSNPLLTHSSLLTTGPANSIHGHDHRLARKDIFLSYNRQSSDFVDDLYDKLVGINLIVWRDKTNLNQTNEPLNSQLGFYSILYYFF